MSGFHFVISGWYLRVNINTQRIMTRMEEARLNVNAADVTSCLNKLVNKEVWELSYGKMLYSSTKEDQLAAKVGCDTTLQYIRTQQ